MKVVLRFGALAVGVALATGGGVGEAAEAPARKAMKKPAASSASKTSGAAGAAKKGAQAKKAEEKAAPPPGVAPEDVRRGPARVKPATAKFADIPRIADSRKNALADKKRDEAIEAFKRLIPKLQDGNQQKAEMLYRLSELYWEKSKYLYQLEMDRFLAEEKKFDAAQARGEKLEAPKQDHRESERYRTETMGIYEDILRGYPQYPQRDEVLFSMGYNLYELGRRDDAVARYEELIKDFPRSQFVPDAYIQLGNHYFESNKLIPAKANYEKARDSGVPKIYGYAVYKLSWCDYNTGDYDAGLKKLHEVVDYAAKQPELGDLRTEALNDLTVFYVQLDQPKQAISYFREKAPAKRQGRLIAKTAAGLVDAGHFDSAILLYRTLIDDEPMGVSAPEYQQAVVRAFEGLRQRQQVRKEMKRMVDLYSPGGEWWKSNEGKAPVLRNAFNVTEEAMRVMVTEYHQEAQKTRQVETYRLARDIYKQYVEAFASSSNPEYVADSAFNLRFFYAEILWALEEWQAAAAEYDAVVAFKIPDRDSAREVSSESYRKSAAFNAILAYDKLVKIERGQLAKSDLKDGQKVDEKKDKGDVARQKIVKRDAKEKEEESLTKFEERLVSACDTYVKLYPDTQDEIDLRYQAAVILYDRSHFVDAARRFGEIIEKFPEERRSRDAADLTMYVLESRQEWLELATLSRKFLDNKKLAKPGSDFALRVGRVVEGSHYKWVDEVVYKQEKNPKKAAEEFLKFVKEFPRSENADRALVYAMSIAQEAGELDRGIEAGERVLAEYPRSPFELKARYTLAGLYEKVADYRKAATLAESFVAQYDAALKAGEADGKKAKDARAKTTAKKSDTPGGEEDADSRRSQKAAERKALVAEAGAWVADAQFNAGVWWEGAGEAQKAVAAYNAYVTRFRERKDVPQVAYSAALVWEKERKWSEAARAFASFADGYGRDSRATPAQLYLARYHELLAWQQLKNAREQERVQAELVRAYGRLPEAVRKEDAPLNAYAHARFLALEPTWKRYSDIRFTRVSTIRRDLAAKQREIQRIEKEYLAVLSTGSGEWGIASLTRIGLAYADFARNIMDSPDPTGLDEDQLGMYRAELENLALPLEDKANEALEKALEKSYELGLYGPWTLAAQDQVNRFHPGAYAQVRQVGYRSSDTLATADLAKEPGGAAGATATPAPPPDSNAPTAPAEPKDGAPKPPASEDRTQAPTAAVQEVRP
ncbi:MULTISPECIES: tetratricopeptide repeat protein [unclassified Myxococcus]|uniref:tetratricopeptide repeat protein n=1 Tax=unclassified Myxococcus TaxID=2648731 RepID=UPI00157B631E|nr:MULTISPECIES: tetratricopeptide repeat protein [unclassified Myxococcus]NTX08192.1 tetratricopeptide repeat protein [Myxococcus sp. CA040A]NTX13586.1 tetratricopeptide repeat protein [Myxococcus sp. CA056]